MASSPIAVFDSGLGGLSVARHIREALPYESMLYFGDCGWAPYGDRAADVILARVCHIGDWLVAQNAKAIVVACNTATTIAIAALRARHPGVPFVGVEPGVKPAVARSRTRVVGVLATEATLRTASFQALLQCHAQDCRFVCVAGHGLVALIEAGALDTPAIDVLLSRYLDAMMADDVDTLVLGSTHFPLLIPAIERLYGQHFNLIETGQAVAGRLRVVLDDVGASHPDQSTRELAHSGSLAERDSIGHRCDYQAGTVHLCSSAASPALQALAQNLLGLAHVDVDLRLESPGANICSTT